MKAKDTAIAADLVKALAVFPEIRRQLKVGKSKYYDIAFELSAAEVSNDEGQGSSAWIYLPRDLGPPILDLAERLVRAKLAKMGVKE